MENSEFFLGGLEIKEDKIKQYLCNSYEKDGKTYVRDEHSFDTNIIQKRIGKNILTGDENWRYDIETNTYAYFQNNKFNENGLGKYDPMLCTHFRWQPYSKIIDESMFQCNDCGEIMFNFYNNSKGIDYFKRWLKELYLNDKPVEVLFILQYPIIIKKDEIYNWRYRNKENESFCCYPYCNDDGLAPILNEDIVRTITRRK